jgi:hypothetical protein
MMQNACQENPGIGSLPRRRHVGYDDSVNGDAFQGETTVPVCRSRLPPGRYRLPPEVGPLPGPHERHALQRQLDGTQERHRAETGRPFPRQFNCSDAASVIILEVPGEPIFRLDGYAFEAVEPATNKRQHNSSAKQIDG